MSRNDVEAILSSIKHIIREVAARRKQRDYAGAYQIAAEEVDCSDDRLEILCLAGELALEAGLFAQAVEALGLLLREGELEGETWYRGGALAMRAFAFIELGDWRSAMADIVQVDDDLEMAWIANVPMLTKKYLEQRAGALAPEEHS